MERNLQRARKLALQLLSFSEEARVERQVGAENLLHISPEEVADDNNVTRFKSEIQRQIAEIEEELSRAGYEASSLRDYGSRGLNIGEVILVGEERWVIGGHLTSVRSAPILTARSPAIVQFITELDGGDWLEGETHGHGIHYHYYNWNGVRTDVILSWDTRWTPPNEKANMQRPLFWEFHAERNAKGAAKPRRWRSRKREFIHAACANDLRRWPVAEFRCAGNDAKPVWPDDSILTPRPTTALPTARRRR